MNIDRYLHCGDFQERGPKAPSCSEKGQEISKPPTPQLSHSLFGVGLICIRIYRSIDVNGHKRRTLPVHILAGDDQCPPVKMVNSPPELIFFSTDAFTVMK